MEQITIHRISCRACGEIFCARTLKKAVHKHKIHVGKCKILRFWKEANKILGKELTHSEVAKLLGIGGKKTRCPAKAQRREENKKAKGKCSKAMLIK